MSTLKTVQLVMGLKTAGLKDHSCFIITTQGTFTFGIV